MSLCLLRFQSLARDYLSYITFYSGYNNRSSLIIDNTTSITYTIKEYLGSFLDPQGRVHSMLCFC